MLLPKSRSDAVRYGMSSAELDAGTLLALLAIANLPNPELQPLDIMEAEVFIMIDISTTG